MKIGIAGYGQMGKVVHRAALAGGHEVPFIIDPAGGSDGLILNALTPGIPEVDVIIDFSVPQAVISNIRHYGDLKIPAVIGTTGWYDHMDQVSAIVEQTGIGLIWSGNFSLGVNLFFHIVRSAGIIMNRFSDYDAAVHEYHHRHKADSPSGTAAMIGDILVDSLESKKSILAGSPKEAIPAEKINITSTRCGSITGTHQVIFDSEVDTITLEHAARNREGFAHGAVKAAEWIRERSGLYSIDDLMQSIIGGK